MIESNIIKKTHKMFKISPLFPETPESHSRNVVWKKILLIYAQFSCKHLPEYTVLPNVAVEGLALLLRLWEVPCSVHCQETSSHTWSVIRFPSVSQGKYWDSTSNGPTNTSFHSLSNSSFTILLFSRDC
jgi:hypothetical protein